MGVKNGTDQGSAKITVSLLGHEKVNDESVIHQCKKDRVKMVFQDSFYYVNISLSRRMNNGWFQSLFRKKVKSWNLDYSTKYS